MRTGKRSMLKTAVSCILCVSLAAGMLPAEAAEEGEGSSKIIYISKTDDLRELADMCAVDVNSKNLEVVLTEDISLSGSEFTPVPYFSGVFDGQGHTVRGMELSGEGSGLGMFRYVGSGAVIRNLNVEGRVEPGGSAAALGGIAGHNEGTIKDCRFKGSIRADEDGGGIAGINASSGTIISCFFQGKVVSRHRAGGIAGKNEGSILNCKNDGDINTEYIETDTQTKSSIAQDLTNLSSFDVSSVSAEDFVDIMDAGGIAGYSEGQISQCHSSGNVGYPHTGYNTGGIVGRSSGFTVNCTNDGAVSGRKDIGGIVGQLEPESIWEYSRGRMEELREQLLTLNTLLDRLASDVSGSSEQIRDNISTASEFAEETIRSLQGVTDSAGEDIEAASASVHELTQQLQAAYDENNAQAARDSLSQLAQIITSTDLFSQPVYVSVKGNSSSDLDSVLKAHESDWWRKLDEYLDSRESSAGRQIPEITPAPQDSISDAAEASGDTAAPDQGAIVSDLISDISDEGGDASLSDGSQEDQVIPDQDLSGQAISDPDYEDEIVQDEEALPEAAAQDEAAADGTPEAGMAGAAAPEESIKTGSGTEDGGIVTDDSEGTTVLDFSSDIDRTVSGGDASLDRERSSDVKVDVDANLPDRAQMRTLISSILVNMSNILDPAAIQNAEQILNGLQIHAPDTAGFYNSFVNLSNAIVPIADSASSMTGKAASDIDAITDQLDQIIETFFSIADNATLEDQYKETDISMQNPYQSDSASVESCSSTGEVDGDTDIGGICGCVGFENKIDAEGVLDISKYMLRDAEYTIFASQRKCSNTGPVTARKEAAGGICGYMEFGIITDSVNSGAITVTEGSCCGGICGKSQGTITDSCAGSLLSGKSYVGGIAGKGNAISSCISYSYIGDGEEYIGAVAGQADGAVSGCRYVDYGVGGIDNIGYAGAAEPVKPKGSRSSENNTEPGNGGEMNPGRSCTVTFIVDGKVFKEVKVPFGEGIEALPQVPNKGTDYWVWDDFDNEHIFSNQEVTGSYHRAAGTISTDQDIPDYLVEGVFYEGQKLSVEDYEPDESPVSTESIAQIIGGGIRTGTSAGVQDTETEAERPEGGLREARHRIRQVITDTLTGQLLDAKTLTVNDYDSELKVRARLEAGGRLFTTDSEGKLAETAYEKDGSYIVFDLKNGGSFAYYESIRQDKSMKGRIAAAAAICAAILVCIFIIVRRRRRHRH